MNRTTLFFAMAVALLACAALAVVGTRRLDRLEASLARSEETITRLEAEARKAARFRIIQEALSNPPPGINQLGVPPGMGGPASPLAAGGAPMPAGPEFGGVGAAERAALMSAPSSERIEKFLEEAKITHKQWDNVQKANTEAKSATQALSRELPDDIDPALAEAKLNTIEARRSRALDDNLRGAQREAYEKFRAHTEMESVVSFARGQVKRYFTKY